MEKSCAIIASILNLQRVHYDLLRSQWRGGAKDLGARLQGHTGKFIEPDKVLFQHDRILEDCVSGGYEVLYPEHPDYPPSFANIDDGPIFLNYAGDLELLRRPSISVVGARKPLPWVEHWLENEWVPWLRREALVTVSGGAIGIDQIIHRSSLRVGQPTVAVLPSGLRSFYPRTLHPFLKYIDVGGLGLLSEYPPDQTMKKFHFYRRNRLISAMSPDLFVVQAEMKSGTMISARFGIDQGRNVFTLAGHPMETQTLGNLQLIFDGAQMVRWASDLPQNFHRKKAKSNPNF